MLNSSKKAADNCFYLADNSYPQADMFAYLADNCFYLADNSYPQADMFAYLADNCFYLADNSYPQADINKIRILEVYLGATNAINYNRTIVVRQFFR